MGMDVLRVHKIQQKYQADNGEVIALKDISFSASRGEFISIVGPSGCGKSTLLSIIAGLLKPTKGEVYVNGVKIEGTSTHIGYMLQKDNLLDWRTIYQNVLFGLEVRKLNTAECGKGERLLKTYDLYDFEISIRLNYPAE